MSLAWGVLSHVLPTDVPPEIQDRAQEEEVALEQVPSPNTWTLTHWPVAIRWGNDSTVGTFCGKAIVEMPVWLVYINISTFKII